MPSYQITGRSSGGTSLVAVSIGSIDQEQPVMPDMAIVDAVRDCLAAVDGVASVVARKYEQVITVV